MRKAQVHKMRLAEGYAEELRDVPAASADPDTTSAPTAGPASILRFVESATPIRGRNVRATAAGRGQYCFGLFPHAYLGF